MLSVITDEAAQSELAMSLDELAREGARRMLAAALEAEVDAYITGFAALTDEHGHRLVRRNGHAPARQLATGAGQVEVTRPRVDDRRVDPATGYRVAASPGGVSMDVGDVTSAVAGNLSNGTAYTFTVAAINAAGVGTNSTASTSVTPQPTTVPTAPTQVTARAREQSAVVAWQRPASDGGLALNGYTVTATPGGQSAMVAGSETTTTVPNLADGTAYTFRVTASNAKGTGAASAASVAVTPGVTAPDPPADVAANALGNGGIEVDWQAPAYTGGQSITGYTVTVQPGGRTVPAAAGAVSVVVSGLDSQTQYTFTVTATNTTGISAASGQTIPMTPVEGLTAAARVLSDAALATLTQVTPNTTTSTTLTFSNAPAEVTGLQPGNVLVIGPVPAAPYGGLRKVSQINSSGGTTTVVTAEATVTEAFIDLAASVRDQLGAVAPPAAATTAASDPDVGLTVDLNNIPIGTGITMNGSLLLSGTVGMDASIPDMSVPVPYAAQIGLNEDVIYQLNATVTASQDGTFHNEEKKIKEIDITDKVKLAKGKLPVTVVLRVSAYLNGTVSAGMTTNGSLQQRVTLSEPLWGGTYSATAAQPTFEIADPTSFADASYEAGVKVSLVAQIGLLGLKKDLMDLDTTLSYGATVDISGDPWFKLESCLKADARVLFGTYVFDKNLLDQCGTLRTAKGPLAQLSLQPQGVYVAPGGTVQFSVNTYPYIQGLGIVRE
jgi:Fibronectin type III domain/Transposase, Mutator family